MNWMISMRALIFGRMKDERIHMKIAAVHEKRLLDASGMIRTEETARLMAFRRQGGMVVLMSDLCRTAIVRKYYAFANMFAADGGMFAFSGCHTLYHAPLSEEEICLLKEALAGMPFRLAREYENACGGAETLAETGIWKEAPYLMAFRADGEQELCLAAERLAGRFRICSGEQGLHYLLRSDQDYSGALRACAQAAGKAFDEVIKW